MATLTYTVFSLGEAQLHQIHTSHGKVRRLACEWWRCGMRNS